MPSQLFTTYVGRSANRALKPILEEVGYSVGGSLAAGVPVRGCIALGSYLQMIVGESQLVIGDALAKAYEGEARDAVYPRVVLSHDVATKVTMDWLGILVQDEDGRWFMDPTLHWDAHDVRAALSHVSRGLERHASDQRVFEKYVWLADFLNLVVFGNHFDYYDARGPGLRRALQDGSHAVFAPMSMGGYGNTPIPIWEIDRRPERRFVVAPRFGWVHHIDSGGSWWDCVDFAWRPGNMFGDAFDVNWRRMADVSWPELRHDDPRVGITRVMVPRRAKGDVAPEAS